MDQFSVIKSISLAVARLLEEQVSEALGRKVPVLHAWSEKAVRQGALSWVFVECSRRSENPNREIEDAPQGGEQFRELPLLLRSRFLLSAWAPAPDDQELLGAALRALHDQTYLEPSSPDEEMVFGLEGAPLIELQTLDLAEHKLLADGFGMPLAPSVSYWISHQIKSARTTPFKRVREAVVDYRMLKG